MSSACPVSFAWHPIHILMVCISFDLGLLVGVPLQGQVTQSLQVGLYVVFEEDLEWVIVVPHLSVLWVSCLY